MTRNYISIPVAASLASCGGVQQSSLDAAGVQAASIGHLLNFFFILLGAIFVVVLGITLWALVRPRHRGVAVEPMERRPLDAIEARLRKATVAAGVATTLILFGLLIASVSTGAAVSNYGRRRAALTIEVTGNQWWWSARYLSPDPSRIVVTANEIHIPAGRPVRIVGTSHDVIHSFWIPNLQGKMDLIPSRVNTQIIEADRPGRYRGQCAEFCGLQHAHMALWIVADREADFEEWIRRQLQPGDSPLDSEHQRGQQVFLERSCPLCHSIRGTSAAGQTGPDLTHLASRFTIAAGTLLNSKGNLAGWISDPQRIKPGNHMATIEIAPVDLQPLVDYLESLK
jgi:cytochrome c oxidase subunit 2